MPPPDLLSAVHAEHSGCTSRMAATLVLAGVPLAEIESLKRGPWEGLAGRIAVARETLGVTPRQPVACYFLRCGRPTFTYTPAELHRLLLLGLEAGGSEEAACNGHGQEAQP